jgi:glycosyltransferase involved in cell wall biosynthesis
MRIAMIGAFGLSPRMTMSARALPLARSLVARGHQVEMIMPPWYTPDEAERRWEDEGVVLEYVSLKPRIPGLSTFAISWRLLSRALRTRPDLIHIFKPKGFAGLAGWLHWHANSLRSSRIPLIVDEDDWEGPGGWNDALPYPAAARRFFAWQERWGLRHADAVTVASQTLQSLAWAQGIEPRRVHHLPNGPRAWPIGDGARVRDEHGLGNDPIVLLYTRFFEYDVSRLVEAFARIQAAVPQTRLLVVGQGLVPEDEDRFSLLVAQAKLSTSVVRTGWVQEERLPDYFAAADLALYPFADTLINRCKCPVKLVDLLYSGVPVVADAVGEIREYIRHGETGLLTPWDVPEAMAEAAISLLRDPVRRLELAGLAAAEMHTTYAWDTLTERLLRVYASVLPGQPKRTPRHST